MFERTESKIATKKLLGLFLFLMAYWLFGLSARFVIDFEQASNILKWAFITVFNFYPLVAICSIFIIVKNKSNILRKYIRTGFVLALFATLGNLFLNSFKSSNSPSIVFLVTSLAYIASVPIFRNSEVKIILFKKRTRNEIINMAIKISLAIIPCIIVHILINYSSFSLIYILSQS